MTENPLHIIVNYFEEKFGEKPVIIVSAPGRADFLNTHQDYKGLPVVPIAVNLRTYVAISPSNTTKVVIFSKNLEDKGEEYRDEFTLDKIKYVGGKWFGDYIRSVAKLLLKYATHPSGFKLAIYSQVPVGSGLASSAALEVACCKAISEIWGIKLSKHQLAELCYKAEHDELKIPCGRLDQYGSAFGRAILLYPRPPVRVEEISVKNLSMVIADSGIRHSTADIHPRRQAELNQGLAELLNLELPQQLRELIKPRYDETQWEKIALSEIEPYLRHISEVPAKRIRFTILMQKSTQRGLSIMLGKEYLSEEDLRTLGEVLNEQHALLRDLYDVSLPELEKIRDAMLNAGALGAKISGAGLGGALLALVKNYEEGTRVLEAALNAGAAQGWVVSVDEGVRVEHYSM